MPPSKKTQKYREQAKHARLVYARMIYARQDGSQALTENSTSDNQLTESENPRNSPPHQSGQPTVEVLLATSSSTNVDPPVPAPANPPDRLGNPPPLNPEPTESEAPDKYRPPTLQEARVALQRVSDAIRIPCPRGGYIYHDLDHTTRERFTVMRGCLSNFIRSGGKHFLSESLSAAGAVEKGATYARSIRRWIRVLIETGNLPYFCHGWWNVPMLGDEDIGREIKAHLYKVGKYAGAEAIVDFFLDEETRTRLGIPKPISLRTAQRWMTQYGGFRWRKELKGQYTDGHERIDVVEYRQKTYIPFMQALERLMVIYNEHGVPDPQHPIFIYPGEKPVIIWFHDESIFFANDRRIVRWVGSDERPVPFKKGEGNTIMIADFVCPQFGWLKGKNGESARVIFRPGINRDGWFTSAQVVKQLENAVKIVQEAYPEYTHVFVYDNAPCHTKRPEDAISARSMTKGEVKIFPRPITVKRNGITEKVIPPRMEPGRLPDGTLQSFYLPDDHEDVKRRGSFKGMAQILRERGLYEAAEKNAECPGFKFAARSQRFIYAYDGGKNGEKAIAWATKEFRSHRQTPAHIPYEQIAPEYVHM
ncbi:unnamed protein product [Rhizoctonia solani]|uniref:Uncharacterized protein n=1 Tax=Rhizoctonia solani TaxID=456999 RepID=A0A8H3BFG5_9AGAM|nr:unnamed protein product [Rhizoctonia solani]